MVIYPGAWLEMADVEVLRALPNTTTHLLPSEGMKFDYLISSPVHQLLGDHIFNFFLYYILVIAFLCLALSYIVYRQHVKLTAIICEQNGFLTDFEWFELEY